MKLFRTFLNESYEHFKKTIAKKAKAAKKSSKQLCNWFAGCTNPATGTTPHPILGPVHTCNKCHKFATDEDRSIKEGTQFDKPRKVIGGEAPKGTFAHDQKHKLGVHALYKKKGGLRKKPIVKEGYTDDSAMAHELIQHADNDENLHRQSHQPIVANLKKKVKKGVYDSGKATKLWGYHADRAAQSYNKQHGDKYSPAWHKQFTPAVRKIAAAHWEVHHRDELKEAFNQEQINLIEDSTEDQLDQMCESETLLEYKSTSSHPELLKTHMLAHEKTGKEIKIGSKVKGFRGTYHIKGFEMPHHSGSTGRVIVHDKHGAFGQSQYFPGVVDAKIVKRKKIYEGFEDHTRYSPEEAMKVVYGQKIKKVKKKKKEKPFRDAAVTGKARDFANEEVVNELSKKTLSSYYSKAIGKEDSESPKFNNRVRGTNTAVNKLTKIAKNEEVVVDEAKKLKDTVGFLSPEVHAKYAKERKTTKQFASAKREINRLKRQGK